MHRQQLLRIVQSALLVTTLMLLPTLLLGQQNPETVQLEEGDAAPHFASETANGESWDSREQYGDGWVVVYFYPAALTGGCTAQACSFRDNRTQLTEMGAEVVGISGDRQENLRIFQRLNNLNFPLISDRDGSIARAFGVETRDGGTISREVDGETVELTRDVTTARWTFIVDPSGTVVYKDTEVDAAGDSERVLAALERLQRENS
ncbi:MAG: peroxiredoxin [Bacteroidota bacterium]